MTQPATAAQHAATVAPGGRRAEVPAEPAAQAPAEPAADAVTSQIVQIVSEMTGYPAELLDLDLDLEADLGVDTVKQAEVFAAVRERFGIPRDENLRLRDFPTLAHVIGFARDRAQLAAARLATTPRRPRRHRRRFGARPRSQETSPQPKRCRAGFRFRCCGLRSSGAPSPA